MQDEDLVCEIADELHVMLYPDNCRREFVPRTKQEARKILLLLTVKTCGGLVQQHQRGLGGESPRKPDDLLYPVRQISHRMLAVGFELEEIDDGFDLLALLQFPAPATPQKDPGAQMPRFAAVCAGALAMSAPLNTIRPALAR